MSGTQGDKLVKLIINVVQEYRRRRLEQTKSDFCV